MKHVVIFLTLAALGFCSITMAQSINCPGLQNPTSFNSMSFDVGSWTARVGDRIEGSGGSTGSNVLSTCSRPNWPVLRNDANILSATHNSGFDNDRCACNHCTLFDGHDQRFRIYTSADANGVVVAGASAIEVGLFGVGDEKTCIDDEGEASDAGLGR